MVSYTNNQIVRIFAIVLSAIAVELYFFPLQTYGMPINSKTIFAAIGLVVAIVEMAKKGYGILRSDLILLTGLAFMVSLCSYASLTLNATSDTTYLTYIISMWVWLSAAYFTLWLVKQCLGSVSIATLTYLLLGACLFECITALGVDMNPTVYRWVNSITDHEWVESVKRMHGLSAELDTAGIHFAVVLIMISYVICDIKDKSSGWILAILWLSFVVITVIGNMIARTTITGTAIGLAYILWKSRPTGARITPGQMNMLRVIGLTIVIALPVIVYFYNNDSTIHANLRFAFEGFFSLVEKGEWDVASNNTLKGMIVWPDNLHTWILGDGYIVNPKDDPYYVGEITGGYYKNTDIGYLRFIFYFGIIGLLSFTTFIVMSARACMVRLPKYSSMVLILLILGFVVWLKVSTDLFFIFALLLCVDIIQEDSGERKLIKEDIIVKI